MRLTDIKLVIMNLVTDTKLAIMNQVTESKLAIMNLIIFIMNLVTEHAFMD